MGAVSPVGNLPVERSTTPARPRFPSIGSSPKPGPLFLLLAVFFSSPSPNPRQHAVISYSINIGLLHIDKSQL